MFISARHRAQASDRRLRETVAKNSEDLAEIRRASLQSAQSMQEMHKLLHNEFAGRLRGMQVDLDTYRERERGFIYDGLLAELASLYSDNCHLLELASEGVDPKLEQQLGYLFESISGMLERFEVTMMRSKVGEKRNNRHCQVLRRIPTTDENLHDTVVTSYNIGFYIDNRTLVKEKVDIYVYRPDEV